MRYPMIIMGLAALFAFDMIANQGRWTDLLLQSAQGLFQ